MAISPYIRSLRLRTLPLSMSGIILGSGMAYPLIVTDDKVAVCHWWVVFAFAILTTLSLQILSNLSNELGDALRGTDTDQHARVAYGLQSGEISQREMKIMIGSFVAFSIIFGTTLIYFAFGSLISRESVVFFLLGATAIIGAMTYTLGNHNYGYKGLGDLGVFLFFGLLSTIGSFYLEAHAVTYDVVWASVAIAMPIVGVLNLNNVRDMDNDLKHGKRTFAGLLGKTGGKVYHVLLLATCFVIFACLRRWYVFIALPVIIWHLWYLFTHRNSQLDLQMPVLMFTTIVIAILALF